MLLCKALETLLCSQYSVTEDSGQPLLQMGREYWLNQFLALQS